MDKLPERLEFKSGHSFPLFAVSILFGIVAVGLIWAAWHEPTPAHIFLSIANFVLFLLIWFAAKNPSHMIFDAHALTINLFGKMARRYEWTEIHSFQIDPRGSIAFIEAGKENEALLGYTMFVPIFKENPKKMIATMEAFRNRALTKI